MYGPPAEPLNEQISSRLPKLCLRLYTILSRPQVTLTRLISSFSGHAGCAAALTTRRADKSVSALGQVSHFSNSNTSQDLATGSIVVAQECSPGFYSAASKCCNVPASASLGWRPPEQTPSGAPNASLSLAAACHHEPLHRIRMRIAPCGPHSR